LIGAGGTVGRAVAIESQFSEFSGSGGTESDRPQLSSKWENYVDKSEAQTYTCKDQYEDSIARCGDGPVDALVP
jgi:hypothetical protein